MSEVIAKQREYTLSDVALIFGVSKQAVFKWDRAPYTDEVIEALFTEKYQNLLDAQAEHERARARWAALKQYPV